LVPIGMHSFGIASWIFSTGIIVALWCMNNRLGVPHLRCMW
jgi:hypothetical protein